MRMALFTAKIGLLFYCLCSVVCCLSGHKVVKTFEIIRDKHDTFRNLECQKSKNCSKEQCEKYGANCADDKCERCQCENEKNTFLVHPGNCTEDKMVIPESGKIQNLILHILR